MYQQQQPQFQQQQQQQQSGQKIQNPESPIQKTPQMNDRDLINDLLSTEKYMTTSYSVALHEASHDALYQDLLNVFTETQNKQREIYNLMFEKGWYKLEPAEQQKLQQSFQQFTGYTNQFPYGNGTIQ
ncbi:MULTISPECIES: spore coat protein [unclassified Bacillus (in: firmicutes)]|uniref:spore coat protein n=1 Tax=unclassified Bacillus (in: firmicutes) TaxID=185979 RepID=UPI0008EF17CD|nr:MULTISPECIES: spore coat protein [unclassified Bacillus (in: firmicutes)]SFB12245.1 Spore coat protein CotF [Bacillus sp. UNCCL13]SFQ90311.1 Spore coat protein CotF [Bacillus sp. cl95]